MLIGITGNIASGKSEVARLFGKAGYTIYDADTLAHDLYETDKNLLKQLAEEFGEQVLNEDGSLNRTELGYIVFSDNEMLSKLNAIVHPKLLQYIQFKVFNAVSEKTVLDAALIVEWEVQEYFDTVIVVTCDDEIRCERLMARNKLSEDEAVNRMHSQMDQDEKVPFADYAIDNSGTLAALTQEVVGLLDDLNRKFIE